MEKGIRAAHNSRPKLTFASAGATLEVDADGSYESVVHSTAAKLRDLL